MSALIEFDEVCKYYQMGDTTVKAADHITMKIEKGEADAQFYGDHGSPLSGRPHFRKDLSVLHGQGFSLYRSLHFVHLVPPPT